jgi:hypothetical protein
VTPFTALFRSLIRASADPVSGGAARITGARRSAVAQALLSATAAELRGRVLASLDAFTRGEPRADDVTLLTPRWTG